VRTDRGWRRFYAVGWLVSAAAFAAAFHQWKMHVHEVVKRAEEAERTQEEFARRLAVEERLRIARELHDSLTHSISVVSIQANVATHLARKRGEDVPESIVAIQEAAGEAMRELRDTLATLRSPDQAAGHGLADLPALVSRTNAAGLPTRVAVTGRERPVPPLVDAAAFRIVQEALTNAARHAGPATVTVLLDYRGDTLTVPVDDDGTGVPGPVRPGRGLVGMRERTTALGGRLDAAPVPTGGFRVRAELPVAALVADGGAGA
jgi:signal transduction histidine kinase